MKQLRKILITLVVLALGGLSLSPLAWAVSKGDAYPAVPAKHRVKGELNDKSVAGKVTVINFWATWCAACKVELVEMEEQFKALSKNPKIQFAFVSLDKKTKEAVAYVDDKFGTKSIVGSNLYFDPQFELAEKLELGSFPTTLVVGPDGKVAMVHEGFKEGGGSTEKIAALAAKLAK